MRGRSVLIAGTFVLCLCKGASADQIDDALRSCLNLRQPPAYGRVYLCSGEPAQEVYDLLSSKYGNYEASITGRSFGKFMATNSASKRTYCYEQSYYIRDDRRTFYTCLYRLEFPDQDNDDENPGVPTYAPRWRS